MAPKALAWPGQFRLMPLSLRGLRKNSLRLDGASVYLQPPIMADYPAWARLRRENQAYLQPREPSWHEQELTRNHFSWRLRSYAREARAGQGHAFFIRRQGDNRLMGACNLGHIRRGAAQMAGLGYWIGAGFANRGYMSEAVGLVCDYGFSALGLNRIEAACMIDNHASAQVLLKNHFREEGRARHYLKINGAWADHRLFALCREDVIG
jgi:ribosomal-protein-alanine N-acetyltransferase